MAGVTEARPIELEDLTPREQKLAVEINGVIEALLAWRLPTVPRQTGACGLWAQVQLARQGRVVAVEGPRGAGKTSLFLTLIREWQRLHRDDAPSVEWTRLGFGRVAPKIRVLPILDFDPLPDAIPLHGWLLEPWRKLALATADRNECSTDTGYRDNPESLGERWNSLFEIATIGWSASPPNGRGFVERALESELQTRDWLQLKNAWSKFVDEVAQALSQAHPNAADVLPTERGTIFVVPIDDVDLQCERVPELLHAIRLLWHPQVLYLITLEAKHLRRVLELDALGRHLRLVGHACVPPGKLAEVASISDELAAAMLQKALPIHAQFELTRLGLEEVLSRRIVSVLPELTVRDVLNKLGVNENNQPSPSGLGDWLRDANRSLNVRDLVTHRQLQHACDRIVDFLQANEFKPAAYELLRTLVDPERELTESLIDDEADSPPESSRNPASPLDYSGSGIVYAFSDRLDWWTERVRNVFVKTAHGVKYRFRSLDKREMPSSPSADQLMLSVLLNDQTHLNAPGMKWEVGRLMVWTEWSRGREAPALLFWPLLKYPNPRELTLWANDWSTYVASLVHIERAPEKLKRLASGWIYLTAAWAAIRPAPWPIHEGNLGDALSYALEVSNQVSAVGPRLLFENLIQLASPGVALPPEVADVILEFATGPVASAAEFTSKRARIFAAERWDLYLGESVYQGWLYDEEGAFPNDETVATVGRRILRESKWGARNWRSAVGAPIRRRVVRKPSP